MLLRRPYQLLTRLLRLPFSNSGIGMAECSNAVLYWNPGERDLALNPALLTIKTPSVRRATGTHLTVICNSL